MFSSGGTSIVVCGAGVERRGGVEISLGNSKNSQSTILIVADDGATAGLKPTFLQHPDIRLLNSLRNDEAVGSALSARPTLIIEDVDGANGQGLDICRRLKTGQATRAIPLIVVAAADLADAVEAVGPDAIVRKPIVQREYFEAVRQFVPLPERRVLRHLVNLRFTYRSATVSGQAFSRDLSLQGAFLKTDRAPEQGAHLDVCFSLPGDTEPLECGAVVRRTLPVKGFSHKKAGFGIEFEGICEEDLARLECFIESHLERHVFSR